MHDLGTFVAWAVMVRTHTGGNRGLKRTLVEWGRTIASTDNVLISTNSVSGRGLVVRVQHAGSRNTRLVAGESGTGSARVVVNAAAGGVGAVARFADVIVVVSARSFGGSSAKAGSSNTAGNTVTRALIAHIPVSHPSVVGVVAVSPDEGRVGMRCVLGLGARTRVAGVTGVSEVRSLNRAIHVGGGIVVTSRNVGVVDATANSLGTLASKAIVGAVLLVGTVREIFVGAVGSPTTITVGVDARVNSVSNAARVRAVSSLGIVVTGANIGVVQASGTVSTVCTMSDTSDTSARRTTVVTVRVDTRIDHVAGAGVVGSMSSGRIVVAGTNVGVVYVRSGQTGTRSAAVVAVGVDTWVGEVLGTVAVRAVGAGGIIVACTSVRAGQARRIRATDHTMALTAHGAPVRVLCVLLTGAVVSMTNIDAGVGSAVGLAGNVSDSSAVGVARQVAGGAVTSGARGGDSVLSGQARSTSGAGCVAGRGMITAVCQVCVLGVCGLGGKAPGRLVVLVCGRLWGAVMMQRILDLLSDTHDC